jgi:hypothetical protein
MSILRHIQEQECKVCGSPPVREEISGLHSNGQQLEHRTFKCGRVVSWVPNFERLEVVVTCPKSQAAFRTIERRNKALKKLEEFVGRELGLTEVEKEAVIAVVKGEVRYRLHGVRKDMETTQGGPADADQRD